MAMDYLVQGLVIGMKSEIRTVARARRDGSLLTSGTRVTSRDGSDIPSDIVFG